MERAILARAPEHDLDALARPDPRGVRPAGLARSRRPLWCTWPARTARRPPTRMVDALLREFGLRTGRFTSPHLHTLRERISFDGQPIDGERFIATYDDVAPYLDLVDSRHDVRLSFFEVLTGMAFAAFADAPVDVAVLEVGHGRRVGRHQRRRRPGRRRHADRHRPRPLPRLDVTEIAGEKAGILKPGVVRRAGAAAGRGRRGAAAPLGRGRRDRRPRRAGVRRAGAHRWRSAGSWCRCAAWPASTTTCSSRCSARTRRTTPRARWRRWRPSWAAATPSADLDIDLVRAAFAGVTSPGRLETIRSSPTVVLDAAHNPAGAACHAPRPGGVLRVQPAGRRRSPRWPTRTCAACSRRSSRCWPRS